jgi:hypothetical protein
MKPEEASEEAKILREFIKELRIKILREDLCPASLMEATTRLCSITGIKYNTTSFPNLENTSTFKDMPGSTPVNLAEALIWKLGKWSTYKRFAKNFHTEGLKVSDDGGVVLSAFAKHLQDNSNPIYDQHALRALWAITNFEPKEKKRFKSLLFDGAGKWKPAGSGDKEGKCYESFSSKISVICADNKLCSKKLDQLLMPLGQAIKKVTSKITERTQTSDFVRFSNLISQSID